MGQFRSTMHEFIRYVEEKNPEINIDRSSIGFTQPAFWIAVASKKDDPSQKFFISADFSLKTKRFACIPLNDTLAYFFAEHVLSMNLKALNYALNRFKGKIAEEQQ